MIVELRYDALVLSMSDAAPCVTSAPLSIASRLSQIYIGVECLTSTLEPGQKIRFPLESSFNPDYLSFAVTIARKRDAKCKRIFHFPSSSESFLQLVRGGSDGSVEHIGEDIACRLTDDAPNMPLFQQMQQLIAQSPRAQAKFFLLMDDIADIYFMGMDSSSIEDQLASTAIYPVSEDME